MRFRSGLGRSAHRPELGGLFVALAVGMATAAAGSGDAHAQASGEPKGEIRLVFLYGSEKKTWVTEATTAFNDLRLLHDGERIFVDARPAGSNVVVGEALEGKTAIHLISPASRIFMEIANGQAVEAGQKKLVNFDEMPNLVNSPLVVATWPKLAERLGWHVKPPSWREVFKYAAEPHAFDKYRGRWGSYKYGHTHPEYSNSGLLAAVAEVYAGLNRFDPAKISLADVKTPALMKYLTQVEGGVIHYGESTGFFATKMFDDEAGGSQFLSAAILYENLVFEENKKAQKADPATYAKVGPKVVAIYPAEGTFPNTHPVAVVERDWVKPRHREAARKYIDFLRSKTWQERARDLGFRPAIAGLGVEAVLKPEYGVDSGQFADDRALEIPKFNVIGEIRRAWRKAKRPAEIVLAIDTSGSMKEKVKIEGKADTKIKFAEEAAKAFVEQLSDGDTLVVILFNRDASFLMGADNPGRRMDRDGKDETINALTDLIAEGPTSLYDAVELAYANLEARGPKGNRGLVVLSDGRHEKEDPQAQKDADRKRTLDKVANDGEKNIFVFTIGYGDPSDPKSIDEDFLKEASKRSKGRYFPANPAPKNGVKPVDIRQILRDIVTFF